MSVGTPVIASRVGFVEEMLGSDYPFLIKAGDKTSLKNAILRFSSIPDHSALSRKLLKTYHDQFSQAKHKKELFRIFGLLV
jgi:glycosyltransferase involved in cell wall biosynthesis